MAGTRKVNPEPKQVLIRWKQKGMLIQNGKATARVKGDEDLCEIAFARSMEICGKVEILNKEIDRVVSGESNERD